MHFHKAFHRRVQTIAQARLVRATGGSRDQVDITFAHRLAVFGEGHAPDRALALGKTVVLGVGKTLAFKQRNDRLTGQGLRQVIAQAALEHPGLGLFGFLLHQRHRNAWHQHRLAAQQVLQMRHRQYHRLKIFAVGPDPHRGTRLAVTLARRSHAQGLDHVATGKHQARHLAFAVGGGFQFERQRIGHAHTHAMQAAGKTVGTALALVKLATGVQLGKYQFDHRRMLGGVHAERNAAAIVFHRDRAVGMDDGLDLFAVPGQRFVSGVIQHLLDDVHRVVGAGVHARTLFDRLQPFQDADRVFGIFGGGFACHSGAL